jgi:DNA-binding NarL/FixJ family response regulator
LEAFKYIAEGKRDADVAQIMGTTPGVIRHMVWRAYTRLGAETRTHAAIMLDRAGKLK